MNLSLVKLFISMLSVGLMLTTTSSILACDESEDVLCSVFLTTLGDDDATIAH